jgi:Na+/alanine symporter
MFFLLAFSSRVTFYYGGEKLMTYLSAQRGGIFPDVTELFGEMFALPEVK